MLGRASVVEPAGTGDQMPGSQEDQDPGEALNCGEDTVPDFSNDFPPNLNAPRI